MEENCLTERYTFSNALQDTFLIASHKWRFFTLLIGASAAIQTLLMMFLANKESLILNIVTVSGVTLLQLSISIIILKEAWNYFKEEKILLKDQFKNQLIHLFLTNLLLQVMLMLLIMLVGLVLGAVLEIIGFSEINRNLSMLISFAMTLFIAVRFSFVPHAVVFKKFYYGDALNYSAEMTNGLRLLITGIVIIPVAQQVAQNQLIDSILPIASVSRLSVTVIITAITLFSNLLLASVYLNTAYNEKSILEEAPKKL